MTYFLFVYSIYWFHYYSIAFSLLVWFGFSKTLWPSPSTDTLSPPLLPWTFCYVISDRSKPKKIAFQQTLIFTKEANKQRKNTHSHREFRHGIWGCQFPKGYSKKLWCSCWVSFFFLPPQLPPLFLCQICSKLDSSLICLNEIEFMWWCMIMVM